MIEVMANLYGNGASFHGVTISGDSAVTVAGVYGGVLTLYGTMTNHGTIALNTNVVGSEPACLGVHGSVTLTGGGSVALSDSAGNLIYGETAPATLTNVDNTISGAGTIGNVYTLNLVLTNQLHGTIDATGTNQLVVNVKSLTNAGTLEATNPHGLAHTGGLYLAEAVNNSGNIIAQGNLVSIDGNLSGTGHVEIFSGGTVSLGGTASNGVIFEPGGNGALILKAAQGFSGNVSGFASTDTIDFSNFAVATTSITKITNSGGGAAGSITNVTLTDSASHLSETLHLVNTTAHRVRHQRERLFTHPRRRRDNRRHSVPSPCVIEGALPSRADVAQREAVNRLVGARFASARLCGKVPGTLRGAGEIRCALLRPPFAP
jgi:hypothetical protein